MIKVCPVGSNLRDSPFTPPSQISNLTAGSHFSEPDAHEMLQRQGIEFCDEAEADIIVGGTAKDLTKSLLKYGDRKRYLLWTLEPRFNTCFKAKQRYPLLSSIHIFNLYSNPFEDNLFFFPTSIAPGSQLPRPLRKFEGFEQRPQGRRIVSLMTYQAGRQWRLPYQGRDLDLCNLRTEIAIAAHAENRIDLYGQGWPTEIPVKSNSKDHPNWRQLKLEILQDYHFNLCFENTNWPHYCSEKIWQAIQGGCLPIYYGENNRIYDIFPEDSFIDYAELGSPEALFWFLDEMLPGEFIERYNRCIEAYHLAWKQHHNDEEPTEPLLKKTLAKLQELHRL